eukprot:TRINITY_DN4563_c0_g1_i1.p2 TRINITY_DN4563_c0_g1~~TRINITY_DN4563_c0_g1_i1.p2  ORF type:complete len:192 (-),score=24.17 TRINITY_DN4563_c0_g1_i1:202-777(-)
MVEFSPVTDFRESTCRQYEENTCNRGGYCNFMHLRKISRELRRKLFGHYKRDRSRSYSPYGRGEARGGGGDDRRSGGQGGGMRGGFRGRGGPGRGPGGGRSRGGSDRDFRDDRRRYDDRNGGGGGGGYRRDRERSYSPNRSGGDGRREREGSAERRAKIEAWNRERDEKPPAQQAPEGPPGVPPEYGYPPQ